MPTRINALHCHRKPVPNSPNSLERWEERRSKILEDMAKAHRNGIPISDVLVEDLREKAGYIRKFSALLSKARETQEKWNSLDAVIERVVEEFNRSRPAGAPELDDDLVKALLYTESELGAAEEYAPYVDQVRRDLKEAGDSVTVKSDIYYNHGIFPNLPGQDYSFPHFQVNTGRVTDPKLYVSIREKWNITHTFEDALAAGTEADVRLAVAALFAKYTYVHGGQKLNGIDYTKDKWYNAVKAYKGISAEGGRKSDIVWDLYKRGIRKRQVAAIGRLRRRWRSFSPDCHSSRRGVLDGHLRKRQATAIGRRRA